MLPIVDSSVHRFRRGWSGWLARAAAAILLFELASGLVITVGPFHPAVEWGLLLHTIAGVLTTALLTWYFVRHWKDYASQALSDVLLLGYVGLGALAVCLLSGLTVTWQGLFAIKTTPWLRYTHLVSTLLAFAASVPHIFIAWLRRRAVVSRPAFGWLRSSLAWSLLAVCAVAALAAAYPGTQYRNVFPANYSFIYGKGRPFAPSLAHTATNGGLCPCDPGPEREALSTGFGRERASSRFLRSQPRRIGLGSARQARPRRDEINISWVVLATIQNRNFLLCWKAELSILP